MESNYSFFLHRIHKIIMIAKFCSNRHMDLHSYDTYCNLIKQSTAMPVTSSISRQWLCSRRQLYTSELDTHTASKAQHENIGIIL